MNKIFKVVQKSINSNFYTLDSNHSKITFSGEGKLRLYIKSADLKKMMPEGNLELQEQRKSSINVHSVQFRHPVMSDSLHKAHFHIGDYYFPRISHPKNSSDH